MIVDRGGSVMLSRVWLLALSAGIVLGVLLSAQSGAVDREDVLTPVLALGLSLPLGWGGASFAEAIRARVRPRRDQ
jgi:hypothetical protein